MSSFLDTSIIVRYLIPDDLDRAAASLQLLQRAERGEELLETTDTVIFEAVFVLQSPRQYGLSRERVRELLLPVTQLAGLALPNKGVYAQAFQLYVETGIDFADAFHAAYMKERGISVIYSYDTHYERVEGIERREPPQALEEASR